MNPNARLLKAKLKASSVNDVGSMSLYPIGKLESDFFIAVLNSNLIFDVYCEFINCTVNVQINDLRQLPIRIPDEKQLSKIKLLISNVLQTKKRISASFSSYSSNKKSDKLETEIDTTISKLYLI